MSGDDWQAGDLALHTNPNTTILAKGGIYTVCRVTVPGRWDHGAVGVGLVLNGVRHPRNPDGDFYSGNFRKIRPHTPDAEDAETIRLLNSAPVKEPVA